MTAVVDPAAKQLSPEITLKGTFVLSLHSQRVNIPPVGRNETVMEYIEKFSMHFQDTRREEIIHS